jgi:hypothetical protein
LDVKDILCFVVKTNTEISVVLQRQTDQIGNRILGLLGKIRFAGFLPISNTGCDIKIVKDKT